MAGIKETENKIVETIPQKVQVEQDSACSRAKVKQEALKEPEHEQVPST